MKRLLCLLLLSISLICEAQDGGYYLLLNQKAPGCQLVYPAAASLPTISGLTGWWKSDAGITVSSGHVTAWADQSGNGYTLTPPVTFGPDTLSACPIGTRLSWAGSNRTLSNSSFPNLAAVTVFVVKKTFETQNASAAGKYTSAAGGWMLYDNGSRIFANAAINTSSIAAVTSLTLLSAGIDASGSWVYRDGTLAASGSGVTLGTNTVPFEVSGYQNTANGTGYSAPGGFTPETYEVLVYNRKLTATERASVENYLKTKWGTP